MQPSDGRLQELFQRYYQGAASEQEKEELMALVRDGGHDAELEQYIKAQWMSGEESTLFSNEKSSAMLNAILEAGKQPRETKIIQLGWLRYVAAAVLLLVGIGVWYNSRDFDSKKENKASVAVASDIQPGSNKALLTLSDGSAIALDKVGSGFVARQGNAEISKAQDGILVYNAKAQENTGQLSMNKISTPKGGQYQVRLPDGSKVWLNASSSIRFPSVFAAAERRVEITGEAYFEVAKDKRKPFIVKFNQSTVQVLGTSFNIMAYPEEGASKTTLVEGSVAIRHVNQNAKLKPGQQAAVLSSGRITTRYTPVEEAVAWKNGEFFFQDAGVEEVMRQLSRWYDVEVSYQGKIPLKQFTGRISRQVKLSEIIGMLQYAEVRCRLENRKIIIDA